EAKKALRQAITDSNNKKSKVCFHHALIDIEISRGKYQSAELLLQIGSENYGFQLGSKIRKGAILKKQGNLEEALLWLIEAINEYGSSPINKREAAYAYLL